MLSYRHAFHAGNHADIFKHLCLSIALEKLNEKAKPYCYIDTHAAAGMYALDEQMAQKNQEFVGGVDRLPKHLITHTAVQRYIDFVQQCRQESRYPGSPAIAQYFCREQDRLILTELHANEYETLKRNVYADNRVACHHRDGLEALVALTPPTPKRGIALIDPPYELSDEYESVAKAVAKTHQRWPVGIIAIWYPLLAKARNKAPAFIQSLLSSQPSNLYVAEFWAEQQAEDFGMYGSGVAFINLPWQMDSAIEALLPQLVDAVAPEQGGWRTEWLIQRD